MVNSIEFPGGAVVKRKRKKKKGRQPMYKAQEMQWLDREDPLE